MNHTDMLIILVPLFIGIIRYLIKIDKRLTKLESESCDYEGGDQL